MNIFVYRNWLLNEDYRSRGESERNFIIAMKNEESNANEANCVQLSPLLAIYLECWIFEAVAMGEAYTAVFDILMDDY